MIKFILSLLLSVPILAQEIKETSIFVPHKLGKIKLFFNENQFFIQENEKIYHINKYNLDKLLINLNNENINEFFKYGYILINKLSEGEFSLNSRVRGLGGGPITASVFYWATKSLCWGGVGAAAAVGTATVVTATVASGGTAGIATGAAINAGMAAAVSGTAAGATGAGAVAAALTTTPALAAAATQATIATTTSAGGVAGLIAIIESASIAAGALGAVLPLP